MSPFSQFYWYMLGALLLILEACINKRFRHLLIPGVCLVLIFGIALKSTNNGVLAVSGYVTLAFILLAIIIANKKQCIILLTALLIWQCSVSSLHYRITGCGPTWIFDCKLVRSNQYLSNMYIQENTDRILKQIPQIKKNLKSDHTIYIGGNIYAWRLLEKQLYGPVTLATIDINEQWSQYIAEHPVNNLDLIIEGEGNDQAIKLQNMLVESGFEILDTDQEEEYQIIHFVSVSQSNQNDLQQIRNINDVFFSNITSCVSI